MKNKTTSKQPLNLPKKPHSVFLMELFFCAAFMCKATYAHDPGYQDFYNAKQGTMQADSGCRLLVCLANPKGPMSEPKCAQDVQSMYTEIALQATYWHGPAWIPQCTGLNGQNMDSQINSSGQNASSYAKHQRFTVSRWVNDGDGGRWEIIYSSLRSPVYFPTADTNTGLLITSATPNHIWNATPSGFGKKIASYNGLNSGNYNSSNESNSQNLTVKITKKDITKAIEDPTIHLFKNSNYSNRSKNEFEEAVIASSQEGIIRSTPPIGSFFLPGDKIDFNAVNQIDGDRPQNRVKPVNSFVITTIDKDKKAITNNIKLKFGQATSLNNGKTLPTQDIAGISVDGKTEASMPQYPTNTTPAQIVSVETPKYSFNENTGVITYEDVDGTQTISNKPEAGTKKMLTFDDGSTAEIKGIAQ